VTDVLALERPQEARCANCGAPLHGPFCAQCGQPVKPLDPPVRHFAGEFAQELFDVDNRVLRSFRRLFFSPGFLTLEHVAGRRAPWLSPLKLYLLTSVACFAVLAVVGDDTVKDLRVEGDLRELGFASLDELRAAVDTARTTWMPRVMFLLVPFVAWLIAVVRRRSGRHYPAHLVFALHVYAAGFGVRALAAALGYAATSAAQALNVAVVVYTLTYLYLAFRRAYGIGRGQAIRDTAIVAVGSWLALLAGMVVIVVLAVAGPWIRARLGF
jgi:hypothetical protein